MKNKFQCDHINSESGSSNYRKECPYFSLNGKHDKLTQPDDGQIRGLKSGQEDLNPDFGPGKYNLDKSWQNGAK
jgi:hypothetical protein